MTQEAVDPRARLTFARTRALIVILFASCRPSAVLGRVRTIVVTTINRVLWCWSCAHVLHETAEAFSALPAVANKNASPTVTIIGRIVRIKAPLPHGLPDAIDTQTDSFSACAISIDKSLQAAMSVLHRPMLFAKAAFKKTRLAVATFYTTENGGRLNLQIHCSATLQPEIVDIAKPHTVIRSFASFNGALA